MYAMDVSNNNYSDAFLKLVGRLNDKLEGVSKPIEMVVAGGSAVHYYTQLRCTSDIDAVYSHKLILPNDHIPYLDDDGVIRQLYFDANYNDTFSLMHEDFMIDAVLGNSEFSQFKNVVVKFLSPTDLAVSKLSRLYGNDLEDILALVNARLTNADQVNQRANEAMGAYVGNLDNVKFNLDLVCKKIKEIETSNERTKESRIK